MSLDALRDGTSVDQARLELESVRADRANSAIAIPGQQGLAGQPVVRLAGAFMMQNPVDAARVSLIYVRERRRIRRPRERPLAGVRS